MRALCGSRFFKKRGRHGVFQFPKHLNRAVSLAGKQLLRWAEEDEWSGFSCDFVFEADEE